VDKPIANSSNLIAKKIVSPLHRAVVAGRRIRQITHHLSMMLPESRPLKGLDVGCGAGELALLLQQSTQEVSLEGVDVLVRPNSVIPVVEFDGNTLPFNENSFDFVVISDVLHHTDDPVALLKECARVTRTHVLIKDHLCNSKLDELILGLMDWVGNRGHGVYLPYNYLSTGQWEAAYEQAGLTVQLDERHLVLYPFPFSLIFDQGLRFIARCTVTEDVRV
jgi:SAM-dependent methyltransferase